MLAISSTADDATLCPGELMGSNISGLPATVSNGLGAISYQFEISFDGGTSYSNLGVVTTTSFLTPTQLGTISETVKIRRRAYATYNSVLCDEQVTAPIDITLDTERTPVITPTSGSFIYCDGASDTFTASGGAIGDTYTWEWNTGTTTITSTGTTTDVTILSDGSITLTIDTAAGCSYTITEGITTSPAPAPVTLTGSLTVCETEPVTLTAGPPGQATYTFLAGAVVLQTGASNTYTTAGMVTTTVYTVEVYNATGCSATGSITISVPKLAGAGTISSTADDATLCPGELMGSNISGLPATVSNGLGTISYQFEISFDGGTSYSNLGVVTTTSFLTPTQLGTISETVKIRRRAYATYNSVLCDEQVTAPIDITLDTERTPVITPTSGSFIYCDGASDTFTASGGAIGDTYTWEWNTGTTTITSTGTTTDVTILSDGSITLTIDTAAGCSYTITEGITTSPAPAPVTLTGSLTVCETEPVTLTAGPPGQATYTFLAGAVVLQTGSSNTYTTAGMVTTTVYTVEVYNATGCSATGSITISVPNRWCWNYI